MLSTMPNLYEMEVGCSLFLQSLQHWAHSLLRVTGTKDDKDVDFQDGMADTLYSVLLFTTIRLGLTFFLHEIPLQEMELLNALRDCYMVALTTTSFRYMYRQYLS
jgi:hypothetical protein